jgi:hypothetical protein
MAHGSLLPPAAAITGSPSDAQAEQVRQLREQMDLLDAQQQTRHRLRYHALHSTHLPKEVGAVYSGFAFFSTGRT